MMPARSLNRAMISFLRVMALVLLFAALPVRAWNDPRLVGDWHGAYKGQPLELQMNADGSGRYQGQPMTWQVRYGQLQVKQDGEVAVYAMKVDGDTLVVAGGELASLLVLIRVAEPAAEACSAPNPARSGTSPADTHCAPP